MLKISSQNLVRKLSHVYFYEIHEILLTTLTPVWSDCLGPVCKRLLYTSNPCPDFSLGYQGASGGHRSSTRQSSVRSQCLLPGHVGNQTTRCFACEQRLVGGTSPDNIAVSFLQWGPVGDFRFKVKKPWVGVIRWSYRNSPLSLLPTRAWVRPMLVQISGFNSRSVSFCRFKSGPQCS